MTRTPLSILAALSLTLAFGCGDKDDDGTDGSDGSDGADGTADGADGAGDGADGAGDGADGAGDGADGAGDGADGTGPEAEDCADQTDNDLDGLGDCTDDDCAADAGCDCLASSLSNGEPAEESSGNSEATDDYSGSCGSEGGADLVHAWAAPAAGCYQADTFGSDYDTVLRRIDTCGGSELACDDDSDNDEGEYTTQSKLVVAALAPGDGFLFVVDGYSADAVGAYTIRIQGTDALVTTVDGALADATGASVASGDSSTSTAVVDVGCGFGAGASVSYSWTAPADGVYTFDTYGSSYDTILSLVDGEGCGEIACDDDGPSGTNNESELTATVQGGVTYLLVISGYSAETGTYVLNINEGEGSGGDSGR